ncbi:MAG: SH3 domain-containing protein [Caldilineaceae bacterium]|nr:SH3 domain-containing protein [Caldilineaceae bacterium]
MLTTACTFGGASSAAEIPQSIRSPYPTFTPTAISAEQSVASAPAATLAADTAPPPAAAAAPTESPTVPADTATEAPPTSAPPRLVVNAPLVNVRTGPGTTYNVLTTVERGQEYDIVGKNAAGDWWRFCCVDGQPAWIIGELVDIEGAAELAPVSEEVAQVSAPPPTPPSAPATQAAAVPTAPPAESPTEAPSESPPPSVEFAFELIAAEQFAEPRIVRIFLYVYDGEQALAGYTLQVKKDGAPQTVSATSAGGQPSFTWPIADSRQRFQNMKLEFPNVPAAGVWEVQLADGGGNLVGPPTTFTLNANEPNQELYVRYKKR